METRIAEGTSRGHWRCRSVRNEATVGTTRSQGQEWCWYRAQENVVGSGGLQGLVGRRVNDAELAAEDKDTELAWVGRQERPKSLVGSEYLDWKVI